MTALVSDASVLIELDRGGLIEDFLAMGVDPIVPWLVREEIGPDLARRFDRSGHATEASARAEAILAQEAFQAMGGRASLSGCQVLSIAAAHSLILLIGDRALREHAAAKGVRCHGVLWVLDVMEERGGAPARLRAALVAMKAHRRCRLPQQEVESRVRRWPVR